MRTDTKKAAHTVVAELRDLMADMPSDVTVTEFQETRYDGLKQTTSNVRIDLGERGSIFVIWNQKDPAESA